VSTGIDSCVEEGQDGGRKLDASFEPGTRPDVEGIRIEQEKVKDGIK
jgi:hypothetical protein